MKRTYFGDDDTLIPLDQLQVSGELITNDDDFDSIATAADYLPRIQLYGSNSKAVKSELINVGRFGIPRSQDEIEDLGKSFECLPLAWRPKAMEITSDGIIVNYQAKSAEFDRIKQEAGGSDTGAMAGIEFLIWLPDQKEFVTYFLSSKSARREARPLRSKIGKATTLFAELVETAKYSWHVPKVRGSSTAFSNLPDSVELQAQLEKFSNPSASETEGVSDEESAATDESRR
jgi:hypothetical protein